MYDDDAWDDMSSEYDECVEKNPNTVISDFITEEIKIVANLCKNHIQPETKYTIIDLGSGTGRVLFSLYDVLGDSVTFCGLDTSEPMIHLSKIKQSKLKIKNMSFLNHDVTDSKIDELFDNTSTKIVMCMYNTIGVIQKSKRQQFFNNMKRLAGKDGLVLISAFNGDDFSSVAPKIYHPMKSMVRQIDEDSFDETKLAFKNSLGYYSQWFTKNQLNSLLDSKITPIPITSSVENNNYVLGHIFTGRQN